MAEINSLSDLLGEVAKVLSARMQAAETNEETHHGLHYLAMFPEQLERFAGSHDASRAAFVSETLASVEENVREGSNYVREIKRMLENTYAIMRAAYETSPTYGRVVTEQWSEETAVAGLKDALRMVHANGEYEHTKDHTNDIEAFKCSVANVLGQYDALTIARVCVAAMMILDNASPTSAVKVYESEHGEVQI